MSSKQARQTALDQFLADKHEEGATIPHEYFYKLFGRSEPRQGTREIFKKFYLGHASDMGWLTNHLLENNMDLQNVRSEGYTLLRWVERVAIVSEDANEELAKVLRRNGKRARSIPNVHLLNGEQQRRLDALVLKMEHINAIRRNKNRFGEANS